MSLRFAKWKRIKSITGLPLPEEKKSVSICFVRKVRFGIFALPEQLRKSFFRTQMSIITVLLLPLSQWMIQSNLMQLQ